MLKKVKKATIPIIGYTLLMFIVIGFLVGIDKTMERTVKGRVRHEVDTELRRPIPFIWQASLNITKQEGEHNRRETRDGTVEIDSSMESSFVSLNPPSPPMGINQAGIHVQDAAPGTGSEPQKGGNLINRLRQIIR